MSNKLETMRLTLENGNVTVNLYYWNNTQQTVKMTQGEFLERMGIDVKQGELTSEEVAEKFHRHLAL